MKSPPFQQANHYVPQFYLKRWMSTQGKIWTYRVLVEHEKAPIWKQMTPKSIAFREHLYTRVMAEGESDEFERWFCSDFEMPAATPILKAVADERLTKEDWVALIRYLAAQDVRTPESLFESLKRLQKTLPETMNETLETAVRDLKSARRDGIAIVRGHENNANNNYLPLKVIKHIEPDAEMGTLQTRMVIGRELWLWQLRHVLTNPIRALLTHKWTILKSPLGFDWVTSDNPVVRLNYFNAQKYDFGGGWGSKGTEIFLPLGPRHLLYTRIGEKPMLRGTILPINMAETFQKIIIKHAHRYIFSTTQDDYVARCRPRTIDSDAFRHEIAEWQRWHDEQTRAERELRQGK